MRKTIYAIVILLTLVVYSGCEKDAIKIIGDPSVTMISSNTAEVKWETNFPAKSLVRYGLTDRLENKAEDEEERQYHSVTITDLVPDTVYYYRVESSSSHFGKQAKSSVQEFTSTYSGLGYELFITTEPVLTFINPTSVEIRWETNLPSQGVVYYGTTQALGDSVLGEQESDHHVVNLQDLLPDTVYYYVVANYSGYFDGRPVSDTSQFVTGLNEQTYLIQGWNYYIVKDYTSALTAFNSALQLNDTYGGAYIGRGWCYMKIGSLDNALSDFNTGLEQDNTLLVGYIGRSVLYLRQQSYAEAITDAMVVVDTDPEYVFAYNSGIDHVVARLVLAQAYYATQEYALAQDQCDTIDPANGLDPLLPDTWVVDNVTYDSYLEALLSLIQYLVSVNVGS